MNARFDKVEGRIESLAEEVAETKASHAEHFKEIDMRLDTIEKRLDGYQPTMDALGWLPASGEAKPVNSLYREAQEVWLTSAWVWTERVK
jgi:tetrahydromethanopterin S-methyltransferase subunit G